MALTGAELLVSELKQLGVPWVSTLCGNGLNPFYVACKKAGVRIVDTHNEQAAAYMADAYARLTGRIGVCAVSSGIAHCNALTGVANAYFDGAPLLLITGASAGYGAGRGVFQEFDQVALAEPICRSSKLISRAEDLPFLVRQAARTALRGRCGPVHLTVPVNVLTAEVDSHFSAKIADAKTAIGQLEPELTAEALSIIGRAHRPLIVAGTGLFYTGAGAVMMRFSEVTAIPVVTPIWDRGVVEKPHPNFLGFVGAASGEPRCLEDADLIIVAGARVDYRVGFLAPPKVSEDAYVIRIDVDASELRQGIDPDISMLADPSVAFEQLSEEALRKGVPPHNQWLEETQRRWRLFRSPWTDKPLQDSKLMSGRHIVESIRPLLTEDLIFLIDGGNIGQWAHMVLADHYPSHWLTCGASAVVGWGIPGAMAAKLAFPNKHVLLLAGDGAFGFTVTELESAVRHGLPFVAVVANDSAWGIVVSDQSSEYGEEEVVASRTGVIRFDKVAQALGANGFRVEDSEDLTHAIREGLSSDSPMVIDVPISVLGPADVK